MIPNPQETADLVKFTEEIFYGKLHFCAGYHKSDRSSSHTSVLSYRWF